VVSAVDLELPIIEAKVKDSSVSKSVVWEAEPLVVEPVARV
jgi:hypothetical protein